MATPNDKEQRAAQQLKDVDEGVGFSSDGGIGMNMTISLCLYLMVNSKLIWVLVKILLHQ